MVFMKRTEFEKQMALTLANLDFDGASQESKRRKRSGIASALGDSSLSNRYVQESDSIKQVKNSLAQNKERLVKLLNDKTQAIDDYVSTYERLSKGAESFQDKSEHKSLMVRLGNLEDYMNSLEQSISKYQSLISSQEAELKKIEGSIFRSLSKVSSSDLSTSKTASVLAPVASKRSQIVGSQPSLEAYWVACDNKNYDMIAKILSKQPEFRALCRGSNQNANSENAFHIVAKTNDLELFFALLALDVHPLTLVKRDRDLKIPLQLAIENNASDEVKKALACKTTISSRYPDARTKVCEVFGVSADITNEELKKIQNAHIAFLNKSTRAKKYINIKPDVPTIPSSDSSKVNKTVAVVDRVSEELTQKVKGLYNNVTDFAKNQLELGSFSSELQRLLNAGNSSTEVKLTEVNNFLDWASLFYLQTSTVRPYADLQLSVTHAERVFAKIVSKVSVTPKEIMHSR